VTGLSRPSNKPPAVREREREGFMDVGREGNERFRNKEAARKSG
jgi:hypothetical protein